MNGIIQCRLNKRCAVDTDVRGINVETKMAVHWIPPILPLTLSYVNFIVHSEKMIANLLETL